MYILTKRQFSFFFLALCLFLFTFIILNLINDGKRFRYSLFNIPIKKKKKKNNNNSFSSNQKRVNIKNLFSKPYILKVYIF